MKPSFHASPVNGPFEDPSVHVRIIREGRALLFDIGYIGKLGLGSLLKVTDVFVTHTHIDHFVGFDILLRGILRREAPLRVFGPENIISCVEGKLKGYTWNLIKDYPVKIEVFEIRNSRMSHASFYAENSFQRLDNPESEFNGTIVEGPLFKIKGALLSHQIPVMAYSMEEEFHINIDKAALNARGLPVGPWLSDLKKAIREAAPEERAFEISGRVFGLKELKEVAAITRGQKISYVMDVSPEDENISKAIAFVRGSDMLFCEAYFLERDMDRARERHHLTAALAGRIAREADVGNLEIMHFSPKYRHCADELYQEAMREFRGYCS
ncbi:MAG: ribonuclease Z [Nitrospirae bacterium]|nr:ribonuclease Z [Nitrospirota bacterium]